MGCTAIEDGPTQQAVEVEVREASAVIQLENGNVVTFTDDGDGVSVWEDGKLSNAAVMAQPEMAAASPAEVFWALAGDDVDVPSFLLRHHDVLAERGKAADWDVVVASNPGGWLRDEVDAEDTWRTNADCANSTFNALNCTPNAGYSGSTCYNNTAVARTTTSNAVDKFRASVCGEGGSFNDLYRYKRQNLFCGLDSNWNNVWNQTITEDEYHAVAWTSDYNLTWPLRQYEHTSSAVGAGDSYDWGSMWNQTTCVN